MGYKCLLFSYRVYTTCRRGILPDVLYKYQKDGIAQLEECMVIRDKVVGSNPTKHDGQFNMVKYKAGPGPALYSM